jgi:pheromone shutdown protein TraB
MDSNCSRVSFISQPKWHQDTPRWHTPQLRHSRLTKALSLERVRECILKLKPSIVCLELDQQRFDVFKGRVAALNTETLKSAVKKMIGTSESLEKKVVEDFKAAATSRFKSFLQNDQLLYSMEMTAAIKAAREIGACIKLVDHSADTLLQMDLSGRETSLPIVANALQEFKL